MGNRDRADKSDQVLVLIVYVLVERTDKKYADKNFSE